MDHGFEEVMDSSSTPHAVYASIASSLFGAFGIHVTHATSQSLLCYGLFFAPVFLTHAGSCGAPVGASIMAEVDVFCLIMMSMNNLTSGEWRDSPIKHALPTDCWATGVLESVRVSSSGKVCFWLLQT